MASAAAAVEAAVVAEAIGEVLEEAGGGGDEMGSWGIAAAAAAEVHTGSAIVGMMECSVLVERPEDYDILVLPLLLR